jgi:hypothetical protein
MPKLHNLYTVSLWLVTTLLVLECSTLPVFAVTPTPATQEPAGSRVAATAQPARGTIAARYTLPPTALSAVEPDIQNDRKFMLGGIGSDIWHAPYDAANRFWLITDRGPNDEVKAGGKKRRTFPLPDYTPAILQVQADGAELTILEFIPIVDAAGAPVTGLPNLKRHDDKPFTFDGKTELEHNPSGLDPEALVRTVKGDFWVAEEYGPSLVHVAANGAVLKRFVPQGLDYSGARYPVADTLPAILAVRDDNRGFEGMTLSPDEKILYVLLQSPLSNPDKDTGKVSRNTRVLAFDISSEQVVAQYVYQFEPFGAFDRSAKDQNDMKLSGLAMLSADTLLALERTNKVAKIYAVDLDQGATNILGSRWDDLATTPSLEATADLAAAGVLPLPKRLVIDLGQMPGVLDKIEGVALLTARRIAIVNDNDFNIGAFDNDGNTTGTGDPSVLVTITLDRPLK